MIRQAEDPSSTLIPDGEGIPQCINPMILDDDDLNRVMLDQGRSAPCNASKKKEILLAIHDNKDSIINEYRELDSAASGINLEIKFVSLLGLVLGVKRRIKKALNHELSSCIITLYRIDLVYLDNEHHLQRRARRNNVIISSFAPLRSVMEKVVDKALEAINNRDEFFGQVKLSAEQNKVEFSELLKPSDPALQKCLRCNHFNIFLPESQESVSNRNLERISKYQEDIKAWTEHEKKYHNRKSLPDGPKSKISCRPMKRKPSFPKSDPTILRCGCHQSQCLQRDSDMGSTCPNKCLNEYGERYKFANRCECPICQCTCRAVYYSSDIHKIATQMKFASIDNLSGEQRNPDASVAFLLTRALKGGILASNTQSKENMTHKMDVAYGASAHEMLAHASYLPIHERTAIGNSLGRDTINVLPSGDRFDTRSIRRNNFHASNNSLVGSSVPTFSSGMKDYVDIDYSTISQNYTDSMSGSRHRDPSVFTSHQSCSSVTPIPSSIPKRDCFLLIVVQDLKMIL